MQKELDTEPIYNKRYLKTKIKSSGDAATDFHDKEIRKISSNYICLAVILIDVALKTLENYHLEVFSKKHKYTNKQKNINKCITDDLETSDDSDEEYFCIIFKAQFISQNKY